MKELPERQAYSQLEAIGAVEREIREGGWRWAAEEILRLRTCEAAHRIAELIQKIESSRPR